jgi:hypothetical protein
MARHPSTTGLLEFFDTGHLPAHLAKVSIPVGALAREMVDRLPDDPELSAGLRHLLEAKDCFVRAAVRAERTNRELS